MKTLVVALALVAATSVGGRSAAEPQEPAATPVSTSANSALVEDIIRLWRANLSEDFINKYMAGADLARDLTAEDVVRLRNAGVPETLITSITRRRAEAGAAASVPQMTPGSRDSRRWDGLTRRNSGLVLLKSRWDAGVLEFKDASLRWMDSRDAAKNLLVPAVQVTEQQLTCLKKSGGNECFEWVVKTRSEEYRFRDVGWRQGENAKVEELFEFFRSAYPNLISSRRPVDEK
ncbi:MAG TPA: hypothetical protein VHP60_05555 [Thermoanaerobaculia bacterium]|nr:hypothetical protein [Thermoanaerobaculia bacterium]